MTTLRSLALALLALFALFACSRPEAGAEEARPAGGISFSAAGFDEALSRARSEKRILLVDVYTDWCGWCKKLDREVFSDAKVARALSGVVAMQFSVLNRSAQKQYDYLSNGAESNRLKGCGMPKR